MRFISLLAILLAVAGCDMRDKPAATHSGCTMIASPVERLACFDAEAGTPPEAPKPEPRQASAAASGDAPASGSTIAALVRRNEAARKSGDDRFLMSRLVPQEAGQVQLVIFAPALGRAAPPPYLAISCLSGISRLQLLPGHAVAGNRLSIRLLLDGKPLSDATTWQVLEAGDVVDAGRGLVAIDLLRRLGSGGRLQIESDNRSVDGLLFDADGLHDLVDQQRGACHW